MFLIFLTEQYPIATKQIFIKSLTLEGYSGKNILSSCVVFIMNVNRAVADIKIHLNGRRKINKGSLTGKHGFTSLSPFCAA